jgi:hypothetical protein
MGIQKIKLSIEEIHQKANEIVRKYNAHVRFDYQAIQCAITEVESNIELLSKLDYETDFMGYKAILEHLKEM